MTVPLDRAGAILTIDLDGIAANWRLLSARIEGAGCAAVVKADAYGLGADKVAGALEAAGCRDVFVAHLEEGIALRGTLAADARVFVLNGIPPGTEPELAAARLIPVVNTLAELSAWRGYARTTQRMLPTALQIDCGMARLGLAPKDVSTINAEPSRLEGLSLSLVMSHLACADDPAHSANDSQRLQFDRLRAMLPAAPASLANSSGIFLGAPFHFDLVRPGAALYGLNPTPSQTNPMQAVVHLAARVIQLREVPSGAGIGYGHADLASRASQLATIALGYADGWPRNAAIAAMFGGSSLPFLGRVSMDSIILDITDGPLQPREGDLVDLIFAEQTLDDVARAAGTIGYEILTRLGSRFHRRYICRDTEMVQRP